MSFEIRPGVLLTYLSYPTASVAAKGCLGLLVSIVIANSLSSIQVVQYIQLLFAQSVFIAFISGVSFIRSVRKAEEHGHTVRNTLGYFAFALLTGGLLFVFSSRCLPLAYLGVEASELMIILMLLCLGGVASGLVAFLQGAVVRSHGPRKTYLPGVVTSLLGSMYLLVNLDTSGMLQITLVIVLAQVVYVMALLPNYVSLLSSRVHLSKKSSRPVSSEHVQTLTYGLANTVFLLLLLAAREFWQIRVDADFAAKVFIVLRISDLLLQIPYLLVATFADRVRKLVLTTMAEEYRCKLNAGFVSMLLLMLIIAFGFHQVGPSSLLGIWIYIVLAQLWLDIFRMASMTSLVLLISFSSAFRYSMVLVLSVVLPMVLLSYPMAKGNVYSFHVFLVMISVLQVMFGMQVMRRDWGLPK